MNLKLKLFTNRNDFTIYSLVTLYSTAIYETPTVTVVHQVGQFYVLEAEAKGITDYVLVLGVLGPYRYHTIGGESLMG